MIARFENLLELARKHAVAHCESQNQRFVLSPDQSENAGYKSYLDFSRTITL